MDNGFSQEAELREGDPWYKAMKVFHDIYGVGPAISHAWYNDGMQSLQDIINAEQLWKREDQRVIMGRLINASMSFVITLCTC